MYSEANITAVMVLWVRVSCEGVDTPCVLEKQPDVETPKSLAIQKNIDHGMDFAYLRHEILWRIVTNHVVYKE